MSRHSTGKLYVGKLDANYQNAARYIRRVSATVWGRNQLLDLHYNEAAARWEGHVYSKDLDRTLHLYFYHDPEAYRELGYKEVEPPNAP